MTTKVEFRIGAPDPQAYACALLRTASARGARLLVRLDPDALEAFDARLWTFSQLDFLPHCRVGDALEPRSPIVLTDQLDVGGVGGRDCLVNLGAALVGGWGAMPRVIEIVGLDAPGKDAARARFRSYRQAGIEPTTMEIAR